MVRKLPKPDDYGNYWLNLDHKLGPAIFPSKRLTSDGIASDGYVLFLGTKTGFLFDGTKLKKFPTAEEALRAMRHGEVVNDPPPSWTHEVVSK